MRPIGPRRGENLPSLSNPETRKLFLYVMQNEYGAIKIGRSNAPENRMQTLQSICHCKIELIEMFPESGHLEEWLHIELKAFRIAQEWFSGTDEVKRLISKLLKKPLAWPFQYDESEAMSWVEKITDAKDERYWRRQQSNMLRNLKAALLGFGHFEKFATGHSFLDARLATLFGYISVVHHKNDQLTGINLETGEEENVPHYTREMSAAETLWHPEANRREVTTPLECCVAALCDLWGIDEEKIRPLDHW